MPRVISVHEIHPVLLEKLGQGSDVFLIYVFGAETASEAENQSMMRQGLDKPHCIFYR